MTKELTPTQQKCLEWLADDSEEYGMPGGRRTMDALVSRGLAHYNKADGRWEITDVGRMELGPVVLTADNKFANL